MFTRTFSRLASQSTRGVSQADYQREQADACCRQQIRVTLIDECHETDGISVAMPWMAGLRKSL